MEPVETGDAEQAVADVLAGLADTVDTDYPSVALTDEQTWIQVDGETSDVDDYPVVERSVVRVTCHVPRGCRSLAKSLAATAMGRLAAANGTSAAAGFRPSGGRSSVITDPATKNLMVWFLVRVNLTASHDAS